MLRRSGRGGGGSGGGDGTAADNELSTFLHKALVQGRALCCLTRERLCELCRAAALGGKYGLEVRGMARRGSTRLPLSSLMRVRAARCPTLLRTPRSQLLPTALLAAMVRLDSRRCRLCCQSSCASA